MAKVKQKKQDQKQTTAPPNNQTSPVPNTQNNNTQNANNNTSNQNQNTNNTQNTQTPTQNQNSTPPGIVFKLQTDELMLYPSKRAFSSKFYTVDPFTEEWNELVAYPSVQRWMDTQNQKQSWYNDLVSRAERERAAMMGQLGRGGGIQTMWGGGGVGGGMVGRSRYGGEIGIDIPPPPEFTPPPDLYKSVLIPESVSMATSETAITPKSTGPGTKEKRRMVLSMPGQQKTFEVNHNNPISKSMVPHDAYPLGAGAAETAEVTDNNLLQLTSKRDYSIRDPKNNNRLLNILFGYQPTNNTLKVHNGQREIDVQLDPNASPIANVTEVVSRIITTNSEKLSEMAGILHRAGVLKNGTVDELINTYRNTNSGMPLLQWAIYRISPQKDYEEFKRYATIGDDGTISVNFSDPKQNQNFKRVNAAIGQMTKMISKIFLDYGFKNPQQNQLVKDAQKNIAQTEAYESFLTGQGQFNHYKLASELSTVFAANTLAELGTRYYQGKNLKYGLGLIK